MLMHQSLVESINGFCQCAKYMDSGFVIPSVPVAHKGKQALHHSMCLMCECVHAT